jgi:hypothetical protein
VATKDSCFPALASNTCCSITSMLTIIERLAWNKSSFLLKRILQNTQTLQQFTVNIELESIYKSYKKCQAGGLGRKTWRSIKRGVEYELLD